jgi:hypothetical protein
MFWSVLAIPASGKEHLAAELMDMLTYVEVDKVVIMKDTLMRLSGKS